MDQIERCQRIYRELTNSQSVDDCDTRYICSAILALAEATQIEISALSDKLDEIDKSIDEIAKQVALK